MRSLAVIVALIVPYFAMADESNALEMQSEPVEETSLITQEAAPIREPKTLEKKWSFALKPGYFYFVDSKMRAFFDNGGFTCRAEANCKLWGPLYLWMDSGYFQKEGKAIGGTEKIDFKLATITLGFKLMHYLSDKVAIYGSAGPRVFMMMMDNYTPYVSGEDNEIGVGGGFGAGFLFFPFPRCSNVYLDLFADYSWKNLVIDPDEVSSLDHDVDVSSLTAGLGLGLRF